MDYIEQSITIQKENNIDYKTNDNEMHNQKAITIDNFNLFYDRLKTIKGISLIIGNNGIGKSYLLEKLNEKFKNDNYNVKFIKFSDLKDFDDLKNINLSDFDIVIMDGLDEVNKDIIKKVCEHVFSLKNDKVIISSRYDFSNKEKLTDKKCNVYNLNLLNEFVVNDILSKNELDKNKFKGIYNLIRVPRFLKIILDMKDDIRNKDIINKFDLLEMILNKRVIISNERAIIKIEENIHKKILQTLALIMVMLEKTNITLGELINFFSTIKYLDVKSYILNDNIIDSFLNNQLLNNDGNIIKFENKEIMEFLAAKEIYENNFSNRDLFEIINDGDNTEISTFWFNTLSYLINKSNIYGKLILEYIYNNLEKQDNLLDLILKVDYNFIDKNYIIKNIKNILIQYTKLYQYIPFKNKSNEIYMMLSVDSNSCFNEIINIISKQNIKKELDDFDYTFINNLLSCIYFLLDNFSLEKKYIDILKKYIKENTIYYIKNKHIKVRFIYIYLKICSIEEIDNLIDSNEFDLELFDIILYHEDVLNNIKKLDKYVNSYVLNYINKFNYDFNINDSLVMNYINNNYNDNRLKKLLNDISDDYKIASFIHFFNENESNEFWNNHLSKDLVEILYNKFVLRLIDKKEKYDKELQSELFFDRRKGDTLEHIISLCIEYEFITIDSINDEKYNLNYITEYLKELIIKIMLINLNKFDELYNKLENKKIIYYVWSFELDSDEKKLIESKIKKYFKEDYNKYQKSITKYSNKKFVELDEFFNNYNSNDIRKNIKYIYDLINNKDKMDIIDNNISMKNKFKRMIQEIEEYILNIKIDKLESNMIFFDYHKIIKILKTMGYDITKYNEISIILLNNNVDKIKPKYSNDDYNILIKYIDNKENKSYVKAYIYDIIEKLKKYNKNTLFDLIFKWIEYIDFKEYEYNVILQFILDNIELLSKENIKKLTNIKRFKLCQDILIELGNEDEIINRINYIKENLVFEGNIIDIEENGNFEYSSLVYITPLSKIGIKNKKYIIDLLEFMFKKYNEGKYYYFAQYILKMVIKYIMNNKNYSEINNLIDYIVLKEKENKDRLLYELCKEISLLKVENNKNINNIINKYNTAIDNKNTKIYSYNDLYDFVKEILNKEIFDDIKRMNFLHIFRNKKSNKINPLLEETYQHLIGYELSRLLVIKGFSTKVIYESESYDKKRSDIQVVTEGFIENIIIETKLTTNNDISNEYNIKSYINNTLKIYSERFNAPKILFVLINQKYTIDTCKKKIDLINKNNNGFIDTILIDLRDYFR